MHVKRSLLVVCAVAVTALHSANAQEVFFSDDLTDGTSVSNRFDFSNGPDGVWGFSSDPIIQVYGSDRTNTIAGATIYDAVDYSVTTNDSDNVRSYIRTKFGGYSTNSWKAHVAVEAPAAGDPGQNWIHVGLGYGEGNTAYYYEPGPQDNFRIRWTHGHSGRNAQILTGRSTAVVTGSAIVGPGVDVYLTYVAQTGVLTFEVDVWESDGTRFTGIDQTLSADVSGLSFIGDTTARIFFGGNGTTTFSEFSVEEYTPTVPGAVRDLAASASPPNVVTLSWTEEGLTTLGYNIYRSLEADTNYTELATGIMTNMYVDSAVTNGLDYYYKVSGVNEYGEGSLSVSATARPSQYVVFGTENNNPDRSIYKAFDGDVTTFYDLNAKGYVGLDFGEGNEQEIVKLRYFLRNDSWANTMDTYTGTTNTMARALIRSEGGIIQGSNNEDFSDAVDLWVLTTNAVMGAWNEVPIESTDTFRYVRLTSGTWNLYYMAELDFVKASDFTAHGTPKYWLTDHGLGEADDEVDNDVDGFKTWEEYVAGTDPTNSMSLLELNSLVSTTNGLVISWQSVEGKSYSISANTDLVNGTPSVIVTNIMGMAVETSHTNTASGANMMFYRVGVE
ncbi:fibronectin type III domain-containing protein [Pontiellaceae bacterium B1224]|nr:fibronectin type III domain-containing protein [Pontiellaceae bacterium B1224]